MRPGTLLQATIDAIQPLNRNAMTAAEDRQPNLTKPWGSLGQLETLGSQVAGIYGTAMPRIGKKVIITCAGDHGVIEEGVSMFPPETTIGMVYNFLTGGAGINVLARQAGASVVVLDVGVRNDGFDAHPQLIQNKVMAGTANLSKGPAMTRDQAIACIEAGIAAANAIIDDGATMLGTGDMGIANTTSSSAIVAAITGEPVQRVTGRGTGIDEEAYRRKVATIERGLATNLPDPLDALDVLAKVGGCEQGAIAGICLAGAARRVPVVVDGFISGAGALIAGKLAASCVDYLIAGHSSVEIGHRVILRELGLRPILNLDLRLGEGTGAALAMPIVDAACRILTEMNTWDGAAVAGPLVDLADAETA